MSTKSNRVLILLLVAMLLVIHPESGGFGGPLDVFSTQPSAALDGELRAITFPVAGDASYGDTFGACRDGCSRSHQGVDIFAPKLTPLVAAVDGTVVAERRNAGGRAGNKVVIEDVDGWRYIYLHLNNDTPGTDDDANPQAWIIANGLRAGDTVRAGDIIGYLGDSGNAEETDPHLHFEIKPPGRAPVNPTPSVTSARGLAAVVSAGALQTTETERDEWADIVDGWYDELLGRLASEAELAEWSNRLALGLGTEADLVGDLAMSALYREPESVAMRAYVITFGRLPSPGVLDALADEYRGGYTSADVAQRIVGSVDYRDLPSASTLTADEIVGRVDSTDMKLDTWHLFQVMRAYRAGAGRLPTANEIDEWTEYLEQGGLMVDVVAGALDGEEPAGLPPHAGRFSANDLGYAPGVDVRQGPVDLDPSSADAETSSGQGRRGGTGDAEVDFELFVEEGGDGSDTANLIVRIPLEDLAAANAGDAELTVELRLVQPADPDGDPEAEAAVDLVITGSGDDESSAGPRVSTPTTRPPTTRPPTTRPPTTRTPTTRPPTTRAPTTAAPAATTTAPPTTSPPTTSPPTAAPPQPTTTECTTTTGPTTAPPPSDPSTTEDPTTATTTGDGSSTTTEPPTTAPPTTTPPTTSPPTTAPDCASGSTTTADASASTTGPTTAEASTGDPSTADPSTTAPLPTDPSPTTTGPSATTTPATTPPA